MDDNSLLSALKAGRNAQDKGLGNNVSSNSRLPLADAELRETDDFGIDLIETAGIKEIELKMPSLKAPAIADTPNLTAKQKRNICTIAFALDTQLHEPIEAPRVHSIWPFGKKATELELNQAGARPSLAAITLFLGTDEFRESMLTRGVAVGASVGKLLPEQIALISIISDTTSKATIATRLKRAGITWPVYNSWRRQKLFADALSAAVGGALKDSIENSDVQLAQLAQNGDLNAIKYFNEMLGRGPNDKKAVDAMAFAKIILEVVQRHVNQDQALAIAAEIGLEAKKIGL